MLRYLRPYDTFAVYISQDSSVWLADTTEPEVTKGLFTNSATATDVQRDENGAIANVRNKPPTIYVTHLTIRIVALDGATYMGHRE